MSVKPTSIPSGRFRPFANELGTGLRLEPPPAVTKEWPLPEERDLVAKLIEKNQDVWTPLLNNDFCKAMKEASNIDLGVMKGFEWYMKQDYFYVANLIKLEESNLSSARTAEDLGAVLEQLLGAVKFTGDFFATLTVEQPHGLDISASVVLDTTASEVLEEYINSINSAAGDANRILAYVVVIACYQSYYIIAADLYRYSIHKNTPWYKFWAEANYGYGDSCLRQQNFFIDNYGHWIGHEKEITELFRKTCQLELGLWNEALKHSQLPTEKPKK